MSDKMKLVAALVALCVGVALQCYANVRIRDQAQAVFELNK